MYDENSQPIASVPIEWRSGDPAIATVDRDGQVTGVAVGMTEITATAQGVTGGLELGVAPPPSPKPSEIIFVEPDEGAHVPLTIPCRQSPPCMIPQLVGVSAAVAFPGEDVFASARLFMDGKEVTPDASVQLTGVNWIGNEGPTVCTPAGDCRNIPSEEGEIGWPHLLDLPVGVHEGHLEAASRDGKTVSYTWHFLITP